jgi:Tetratricopeptide repeat
MDDCRRPQERVRPCGRPSGGRPPGCPLAPPSRPSQGVHLGRLSGRVSEWVSGRRLGVGIRPPVVLEGVGEQDGRVLVIGEAALGPDHPAVATYRGNLGNMLQALGDLEGARAQYERMLTVSEAALGPTTRPWPRYATTSTACSGPSQRRLLKIQPRLSSVVAASGRTQPTARAASLMPKHTCLLRSSSSTCAAP